MINILKKILLFFKTSFFFNQKIWNIPLILAILFVSGLTGCTEYWWSRGQPPGVSKLLSNAENNFKGTYKKRSGKRSDIASSALKIKDSLLKSINSMKDSSGTQAILDLKSSLSLTKAEFIIIEDNLSPTSRPAFGELAGQLRKFTDSSFIDDSKFNNKSNQKTFELFAARTIFFLARELESPSPLS